MQIFLVFLCQQTCKKKIKIGKGQVEKSQFIFTLASATENDFRYIKAAVGTPLVQGLASLVLHQPQDPINYLASFLLHYQHNQERYAVRKQQLETEEQKLACIEKICEIGAKNSVLK
jgi:hypothetical protein